MIERPQNEKIFDYAPGDMHRNHLKERLSAFSKEKIEIPCVIGGKPVRTGQLEKVRMPHRHGTVLAEVHLAGPKELEKAVESAKAAKVDWENLSTDDRVRIFLKAADLLATEYRDILNASTMLGQAKTAYQAEIDSACELIDFFRFNAYFYQQILSQQPDSLPGVLNWMEYRPLEGFVLAITPFNFTSIAGNLPTAPALAGNTVIWKPARTQMFSAHYLMKLFEAAGFPPGVINMVCASGADAGKALLPHSDLAGVHFTGSTAVFQQMFQTIGSQISRYKTYPRLIGETGGKDFVFAHASADIDTLSVALIRGAFEYQGQKCSAASRAYIPSNLWPQLKEKMLSEIKTIRMGDVQDFSNFMSAVIDEKAFEKIGGYVTEAKSSSQAKVIAGGKFDKSEGYFIDPTVIEVSDPKYRTMVEEIFGPVLSVYVYPENRLDETLELCDSSHYALTGAVFAQDRRAIHKIAHRLRNAAGNFYINDKPTGATVNQQPFGGARLSGTNDKAGSWLNLIRWMSPRSMKENFIPPRGYRYPFMKET